MGTSTLATGAGVNSRLGKYKILVVDDHPIVRQGLTRLISQEDDIEVCGGADSVSTAMEQVKATSPDLVVVDISLKDSHGIELITQVKAFSDRIKILVWSMFDEKVFAERALRAGAMGYVNKQEPIETVVAAIRRILRGDMHLSAKMTNSVLGRLAGGRAVQEDPIATLSNREVEVFHMIGQGMTTQQIARKLGVSPKTVETHREKVKFKLNLKNAAELNCRAVQWVLENG
jgi:DNA-binding NarL/FixJ family response regulator